MERNKKDCQSCKFLYITHDRNYPYGCNAFGFKSKKFPYAEVYSSSGMKCALFRHNNVNIKNNINKNKGRFA